MRLAKRPVVRGSGVSQRWARRGCTCVATSTHWVVGTVRNEAGLAEQAESDLETSFCSEYRRIARVIARVTRDPARAEELAVELFRGSGGALRDGIISSRPRWPRRRLPRSTPVGARELVSGLVAARTSRRAVAACSNTQVKAIAARRRSSVVACCSLWHRCVCEYCRDGRLRRRSSVSQCPPSRQR